jgi:hypothetical protein
VATGAKPIFDDNDDRRFFLTSSTADDIGILAERGGHRRGRLAEGFTCGNHLVKVWQGGGNFQILISPF